jgi:phosphatidylglycerol:prolipoprotein diacylglycerol transferase
MIPYLHLEPVSFGSFTFYPWGFFVALGAIVGITISYFEAKRRDLEAEIIFDLAFWVILGTLIGARLFHVLFYEPSYYLSFPLEILKLWQGGLSSLGGFFGAFLAGFCYLKKQKLDLFSWADIAIYGLPLAWGIGRIGCFLTHQHLGLESHFFLAVNRPEGPRLEMSLLEAIVSFFLFFYFYLVRNRQLFAGFYFVNFLIIYGLSRFLLDFLRLDIRYFGLTPAQYGCLIFLLLGGYLYFRKIRNRFSV